MKRKIAILGGSFNPPHLGHMWIAQQVQDLGYEIWVIPSYNKWGKKLASAKNRIAMAKLAAEDFTFKVIEDEIKYKLTCTYEVIEHLTGKFPGISFSWIVGQDVNYQEFRYYRLLSKKCNFIRIGRPGYGLDRATLNCDIRLQLSSSTIRERIKEKKPVTGLVSLGVESYIKGKGLYG